MLDVKENECIYIGDGGSNEREAAKSIGMRAIQAIWFINKQYRQSKVKPEFEHLNRPTDLEKLIKEVAYI